MVKSWFERGQYANTIKEVLEAQVKSYTKETDSIKKTKIAQSVGYLGQIINSLISSQEEMGINPVLVETEEISEKLIREFIRNQILEKKIGESLKNSVLRDIIDFKKCDISYANSMFKKMEGLGFGICYGSSGYDIVQFAKMRDFLTEEELKQYREDERRRRYS